jgi:hypothetical protein
MSRNRASPVVGTSADAVKDAKGAPVGVSFVPKVGDDVCGVGAYKP